MQYIFLIISLLIAITIHEASHAYIAFILGDPTSKMQGRVSLNPKKHLDPIGTFMILLTFISGFGIGWGKPVPVNPYNFKDYKKGEALVSLAGPMSNFVMALLSSLILRIPFIILPNLLIEFLYVFIMLNIGLMCFNLIPIPPLDGSKILFCFYPIINTI
jgi:Zn-dependent protease